MDFVPVEANGTTAAVTMPTAKVVAQYKVSPPPATIPPTQLPLTFFDVLWLPLSPVKSLFFYQCTTITTHDFLSTHLPAFRRSLSLTLISFFSLAGNLLLEDLVIQYADGDSVTLLVSESDADFAALMADEAKDVKLTQPLVPPLPPPVEKGRCPLLALQFTVFPGAGFSLGMTIHHAAADGNSYTRFLKSWAAIHRSGGDPSAIQEAPVYDRGALLDLEEDKRTALEDMQLAAPAFEAEMKRLTTTTLAGGTVRATFVLSLDQLEMLQNQITSVTGVYPTKWVAACSYVWVCLTKARRHEDRTVYFSFVSGCRTRIEPRVADTYFGNCIGMVCCEARGAELAGEGGLAVASEVIQAGIRTLEGRAVARLKETVGKFVQLVGARVLPIAGSPKLRIYDTDFGWGSPKKVEVISIEGGKGISLAESRAGGGGLEVGLAGRATVVERFGCILRTGLGTT